MVCRSERCCSSCSSSSWFMSSAGLDRLLLAGGVSDAPARVCWAEVLAS